jgi:hypothetical protein
MGISETANRILATNSTPLGQRTLIEIDRAVDFEPTARLDAQSAETARAGAHEIMLDMSGQQVIDEAAIPGVLRGMDTLCAAGADLDVWYPSPMALQLVERCCSLRIVGIEFARGPQRLPNARETAIARDFPPYRQGARDSQFPDRPAVRSARDAPVTTSKARDDSQQGRRPGIACGHHTPQERTERWA